MIFKTAVQKEYKLNLSGLIDSVGINLSDLGIVVSDYDLSA